MLLVNATVDGLRPGASRRVRWCSRTGASRSWRSTAAACRSSRTARCAPSRMVGGNPNGLALGADGLIYVTRGRGAVGRLACARPGRTGHRRRWTPPTGTGMWSRRQRPAATAAGSQRPVLRPGWRALLHRSGRLRARRRPAWLDLPAHDRRAPSCCTSWATPSPTASPSTRRDDWCGWSRIPSEWSVSPPMAAGRSSRSWAPRRRPDGCAYAADGRLVVATLFSGGLDVIAWEAGRFAIERLTWAERRGAHQLLLRGRPHLGHGRAHGLGHGTRHRQAVAARDEPHRPAPVSRVVTTTTTTPRCLRPSGVTRDQTGSVGAG